MKLHKLERAPYKVTECQSKWELAHGEAEAELVAGYNVEYSSMGFALFFLGEYANILVTY